MKKILIGLVCCFSLFVNAEELVIDEKKHEETCQELSAFAYMAMGARQNGTPLSKAIDIANSIPDEKEKFLARNIVIDAYKQTKFSSQKYKDEARVDFADKYMLVCLEMYK